MTFLCIATPPLADHLVRLQADQLDSLELIHLHSEFDPHPEQVPPGDRIGTRGYSEWIAQHIGRSITLGWDWELEGGWHLKLGDGLLIRTNIMLQDRHGADLGRHLTLAGLFRFIGRLDWQDAIRRYLREVAASLH